MVNIKLTYFGIQGPAEPTRLALVLAGIPFEDVRINRDQMLTMREAGTLTPAGCAGFQVPQLEVDGKILLQSGAQAIYCAKLVSRHVTAAATPLAMLSAAHLKARVCAPICSAPLLGI